MLDTDKAYYAGLFDGEGSIIIQKGSHNWHLRVSMGMQFKPIPVLFKQLFGGSVTQNYPATTRPCFYWTTSGSYAAVFLETILPYSKIKKLEIEHGLKFHYGKPKLKHNTPETVERGRIMRDELRALRQTQLDTFLETDRDSAYKNFERV